MHGGCWVHDLVVGKEFSAAEQAPQPVLKPFMPRVRGTGDSGEDRLEFTRPRVSREDAEKRLSDDRFVLRTSSQQDIEERIAAG